MRINEEIKMEECFRGLLGGVEGRVVRGKRRIREDKEEELERSEAKQILESLKEN